MNTNEQLQTTEGAKRCFFRASASDFKKIPGSPIAYWTSKEIIRAFDECEALSNLIEMRKGLVTSDNARFMRSWHECELNKVGLGIKSRLESVQTNKKWFPIHKGGSFRKWYGNHENVINWENDGYEIRNFYDENGYLCSRPQNLEYSFKQALTWSKITSSSFSARFCAGGFLFDDAGAIGHSTDTNLLMQILPILSSKIGNRFLEIINPTLNYQIGDVGRLPVINIFKLPVTVTNQVSECINISRVDWDSYETSWDFACLPLLLNSDYARLTLRIIYQKVCARWKETVFDIQRLEGENNRIFIDAYGLQDELTPEVPLKEITLTCNPVYRYGVGKSDKEYEELQRADTMRELISYAVGCMMGRYSPDTPGLQFAGGTYDHEKACTAAPSFQPDEDGILPVLADAYFEDDVTTRFVEFLKVTFGKEHLSENLRFVAEAIGIKDSESPQDAIRRFLAADFFKYHMRMYKRRPIYWLFSSGKEKAFQALVYLHRYTPVTLARMRTGYLHELQNKMRARIEDMESGKDAATSTAQATRINRDLTKLHKQLEELRIYDEKLHHYADKRIEIDLDDGVKYNYGLFGDLLAEVKSVTGDKE